MPEKPRILVLGTGGTIAGSVSKGRVKSGDLPQDKVLEYAPQLKKKADIRPMSILRAHSADLQPSEWATIANTVFHALDDVHGVVVTHGTDTMTYSSSMLGFMIQNLNKPVVFTGSQVPPNVIGSDAPRNLLSAVLTASMPELGEATIVFGGKIFRACRAKKVNAKSFKPYISSGEHVLGTVEESVELFGTHIRATEKKPVLVSTIEENVCLLKVHPGFRPATIYQQVDAGVKGIVLEAYGWGNIPLERNELIAPIEHAATNNVPVVIASSCLMEKNWENVILAQIRKQQYESSAIHVFDMLPETALVKLMWVLGQTKDKETVKKMMHANYINEITPLSHIPVPET